MPTYKTSLRGQTFTFNSLKHVLAAANEEKSGDRLAGLGAQSGMERVAAKFILADLTLEDLHNEPVVPYEIDEITRMDHDRLNRTIYSEVKSKTVGELRDWILCGDTSGDQIKRISHGLTAEMIAAVAKLMGTLDLVYAASKIEVTAHCNTTIGKRGTLSSRLQPNHTTDDPDGIRASIFEGLSYGAGDAVIGLNPVTDSTEKLSEVLKCMDEIKNTFAIPTQICVLGHINTQIKAIQSGAPMDLIFQSIAGSEKGNTAFGFNADTVREAQALLRQYGTAAGPNVFYFETGQGSELSSDAHYGADQVTMEARCYAFARCFDPFLVNTVVGFIGPEYLYDSKQVIRAGLEDHFMGKLSGLPMGCDCCYTNHMRADQNDIEMLSLLLANAGVNFIIGVPAGDDIMLNYQTNAYHDAVAIRELLGRRPIAPFDAWLESWGITQNGVLTERAGDPSLFAARYLHD